MISPIQLTPNMEIGTLVSAINNNFRQIEAENRTKVIRDESGVNRIIYGRFPDGKYGMKVSMPGIDVLTTGDDELIFNSSQNILKVAKVGTFTAPSYPIYSVAGEWRTSKAGGVNPIPHGLSEAPAVIAFTEADGQYSLLPRTFMSAIGTGSSNAMISRTIAVNVDDTNVYILDTTTTHGLVTGANATAGAQPIKYFLLQESAA